MDDIQELKQELKDVDNRVMNIERDLPLVKERFANMDDLLKQNVQVLDSLNRSMQDNKIAMERITMSLDITNKNVQDLKTNVETLKEERNFNIMSFIKENWLSILALGGVVYYIISNYIK